jgi:hypothetical protein
MEVQWWKALALALPFLAALVLGLAAQGSTSSGPDESGRWSLPFERYLGRLAIAVLGTFGFTLCLCLIGFLVYKLEVRVN